MNDVQARRRSIIEDARATVERLQRQSASWDVRSQLPPIEDKLTRWRREAEAQERAFARERAADKQREQPLLSEKTQSDASWNEWCARKIDDALMEFTENVLVETVTEIQKETRAKIEAVIGELRDEFAEQIGQLRAEITIAKAHDTGGTVIDLPALPLRRRSDAA
jgi:hypothetical protein